MLHSEVRSAAENIQICPITSGDVERVAAFLHAELNGRLSPSAWAAAIRPTWPSASPNHGFMLVDGERVLGAYVAFYSQRRVDDRLENFCNLSAWCVLEAYRAHGLRLLRAMLAQDGYTFTDLSPSGNVVPLNARLNFQHLDTATALVPNWPWPRSGTRLRIVSDPATIEQSLTGRDLEIYRDHAAAPAAHHLAVIEDGECCYVMFRRDSRKRLRLFASILHVGNPALFERAARHVYSHLLTHHGIVATLAETRVVRSRPKYSILLPSPRPKMFRSNRVASSQVDYLYSELTCVPW
ncbi:hypothetical protein [Mycoplana sp. MJR14]|uniref:hypothetical protein n=1 Tax=Mycoplana sp. MJR14 TaxID=3032583 RepID=UPI0023DAE1F2|nr:hypothetical protein [Mycoplana sp. MJR14]MDF1635793.1 hypothetical protein [Mycoplana sp. MJR14]